MKCAGQLVRRTWCRVWRLAYCIVAYEHCIVWTSIVVVTNDLFTLCFLLLLFPSCPLLCALRLLKLTINYSYNVVRLWYCPGLIFKGVFLFCSTSHVIPSVWSIFSSSTYISTLVDKLCEFVDREYYICRLKPHAPHFLNMFSVIMKSLSSSLSSSSTTVNKSYPCKQFLYSICTIASNFLFTARRCHWHLPLFHFAWPNNLVLTFFVYFLLGSFFFSTVE